MLWVIYGILHSMLRSACAETGRIFQFDGWRMGFWQALCGLVLLLPFLPFMVWPVDGAFYLAAAGVSVIFTVGALVQAKLSAERRGRVFAIYVPIETIAAMVIWALVMPHMLEEYLHDSLMTVSMAMAFMFASFSLLRIRDNDLSWRTFLYVAPMGLSYAVAAVVTKIVLMEYGMDLYGTALTYVLVIFAVMTVVMGVSLLAKRKASGTEITTPRLIQGGAIAGLFSAMSYGTFVVSVALAPNPGYVSMMAMLLPVWLLSWHGFLRLEDKASPLAALFIVISILLMIVAAA
ncbi:MAG TPA: hypothetical protein VIF12_05065 [Micavibrio sp.]|jgi:hypothetical protein